MRSTRRGFLAAALAVPAAALVRSIAVADATRTADCACSTTEVRGFGLFHGPYLLDRLVRGTRLRAAQDRPESALLSLDGRTLGRIDVRDAVPVRVAVLDVECDPVGRHTMSVIVADARRSVEHRRDCPLLGLRGAGATA